MSCSPLDSIKELFKAGVKCRSFVYGSDLSLEAVIDGIPDKDLLRSSLLTYIACVDNGMPKLYVVAQEKVCGCVGSEVADVFKRLHFRSPDDLLARRLDSSARLEKIVGGGP